VFTAVSGPNALNIINDNQIQIIVSDQRMPEMQGVELLKEVKKISPNTVRILLTGYADINAVVDSVNTGEIFRFIEKPWNNERLKQTIEAAAKISQTQKNENSLDQDDSSSQSSTQMNILVVDDVLDTYTKIHHYFGHLHNVFCANNIAESLSILEAQDISVLITETKVQGEDMSNLIHVLKDIYPLTVVMVLTTQADAHLVVRLINEGQIFRYLPKQVNDHVLEFGINAALKRYAQFKQQPSLLTSQQFIEKPATTTPESQGNLDMLKTKLNSLRQRMKNLWN